MCVHSETERIELLKVLLIFVVVAVGSRSRFTRHICRVNGTSIYYTHCKTLRLSEKIERSIIYVLVVRYIKTASDSCISRSNSRLCADWFLIATNVTFVHWLIRATTLLIVPEIPHVHHIVGCVISDKFACGATWYYKFRLMR